MHMYMHMHITAYIGIYGQQPTTYGGNEGNLYLSIDIIQSKAINVYPKNAEVPFGDGL